jgi:hypothetical protein
MEECVNVKFCVKLQKLPTGQTPVHGVETEEFPQVKEATDVKVQDQRNVDHFFDIRGIIHFEFVPDGTSVNQTFYVEVLKMFIDIVRRKQRELWIDCSLILHHNNVLAHSSL